MNQKVKKAFGLVKDSFVHTKNFGIGYGFSFFVHSFICRKNMYKTRLKAIDICEREFGHIFDELKDYTTSELPVGSDQKNLFFFWAQGIDKLPEFQQIVLERIKGYYADYNIIKLDLNNYGDYVQLSDRIVSLFKRGKITIQTFSDILRFNLLYKMGGCGWMLH